MVRKLKTKTIIPQKIFESNLMFQEFIDTEKLWMYARIYEAIKHAYDIHSKIAIVMEAKIEDTMSIVTINSDISEWVSSLTLASNFYVKEEMYEKCAEIRDLIALIENAELLI